jgi:hypothetical protein
MKESGCLAFKCPFCRKALYIPLSMGGAKGPCPSCGTEIEGPRLIAAPEDSVSPVNLENQEGAAAASMQQGVEPRGDSASVPLIESNVFDRRLQGDGKEGVRFQARHRIEMPEDAQPDESWREKHHDLQEEFRKRKKREAIAVKLRTKKVGFLMAFVFCLVMGYVLYLDHEAKVEAGGDQAVIPGLGEEEVRSTVDFLGRHGLSESLKRY